jgi:hypothetical protein
MAGNGGKRKGAGRKSKADEEKANELMLTALKQIYKKDSDDDAKVSFIISLVETPRGQIFIAEHLFGKPKESKDITSGGEVIKTIISLGNGEEPKK